MTDKRPKCRSGVIRPSDQASSCGGPWRFSARSPAASPGESAFAISIREPDGPLEDLLRLPLFQIAAWWYRGGEGQAGSDDALHFTVLPRNRRISISQSKLGPCAQFQKKAYSSMHLSLGGTDRRSHTDSMSWMTAVGGAKRTFIRKQPLVTVKA